MLNELSILVFIIIDIGNLSRRPDSIVARLMKTRVTEILVKVATQLVLLFFSNYMPIRGRSGVVTVVASCVYLVSAAEKGRGVKRAPLEV